MIEPFLAEIYAIFFAAKMQGYASENCQKTTISQIPGAKLILFERGKFKVVDQYFVTPYSDMSSGMTIISYDDRPVWEMHYGGWYNKKVIPFLKSCLLENYQASTFLGGRGPRVKLNENDHLYYWNILNDKSSFEGFVGEERIWSGPNVNVIEGYHWYRGGSLLENLHRI